MDLLRGIFFVVMGGLIVHILTSGFSVLRKSLGRKFLLGVEAVIVGVLILIVLFYYSLFTSPFRIYTNTTLIGEDCIFEVPFGLSNEGEKWKVPIYIENRSGEAKVVDFHYKKKRIKENVELSPGENPPFLISAYIPEDKTDYVCEFEIKPTKKDRWTKGYKRKIRFLRQPWNHFARTEYSWVEAGEEFKVEVQTMNYAAPSDFYVTWELKKVTPERHPPWVHIEGKIIPIGQIEENGTKKILIGNTKNEHFEIDEPGLYYIKTYVFKDLPLYLDLEFENGELKADKLEERKMPTWEASDPHQMTLVYVMPRTE